MEAVTLDEEKLLRGRQKRIEQSIGLPEQTNSTSLRVYMFTCLALCICMS